MQDLRQLVAEVRSFSGAMLTDTSTLISEYWGIHCPSPLSTELSGESKQPRLVC